MECIEVKIYTKKELALLYFPDSMPETATKHLMRWAKEISLNGRYKTPIDQGSQLLLQLPKMAAGTHTVEVSFRLKNAVSEKNGALWLEVPLLTGFSYPVEKFSFSVTLPHELKEQPTFSSGYYLESITFPL